MMRTQLGRREDECACSRAEEARRRDARAAECSFSRRARAWRATRWHLERFYEHIPVVLLPIEKHERDIGMSSL